jgi:hypothetical protein
MRSGWRRGSLPHRPPSRHGVDSRLPLVRDRLHGPKTTGRSSRRVCRGQPRGERGHRMERGAQLVFVCAGAPEQSLKDNRDSKLTEHNSGVYARARDGNLRQHTRTWPPNNVAIRRRRIACGRVFRPPTVGYLKTAVLQNRSIRTVELPRLRPCKGGLRTGWRRPRAVGVAKRVAARENGDDARRFTIITPKQTRHATSLPRRRAVTLQAATADTLIACP